MGGSSSKQEGGRRASNASPNQTNIKIDKGNMAMIGSHPLARGGRLPRGIISWSEVEVLHAIESQVGRPSSIGNICRIRFDGELSLLNIDAEAAAEDPKLVMKELFPCGLLLRLRSEQYTALETREAHVEEARKLRDLHHPGLLPFLALATDGLHHWGEVHICQTTSLAFMLTKASQAGKDAEAPAVKALQAAWIKIATDVATAVAFLHERGLFHCALHPANVLLDRDMSAKLCDYGRSFKVLNRQLLAEWQHEEESEKAALGEAGGGEAGAGPAATPATPPPPSAHADEPRWLYLPPEVIYNGLPDQRSLPPKWSSPVDVWSLGCLVGRLASLEPLYRGAKASSALRSAIVTGEIEGPADLLTPSEEACTPAVLKLVKECTSSSPSARIKAKAAVEALTALSSSTNAHFNAVTAEAFLSACLAAEGIIHLGGSHLNQFEPKQRGGRASSASRASNAAGKAARPSKAVRASKAARPSSAKPRTSRMSNFLRPSAAGGTTARSAAERRQQQQQAASALEGIGEEEEEEPKPKMAEESIGTWLDNAPREDGHFRL